MVDVLNRYFDNAASSWPLVTDTSMKVGVVGGDRALEYYVSESWRQRYQNWNLAFIIGNLPNLDILLPKLLIPSVLNAATNRYLFHRVIALWLAMNFFMFKRVRLKSDRWFPEQKAIAQIFGKMNRRD